MRILWITGRRFGHDLCQTTQMNLARMLGGLGHEVQFVSPADSETSAVPDIEFHPIPTFKTGGLRGLSFERNLKKRLPDLLRRVKPDIALCSWRGTLGAAKALGSAGVPWYLIDRGPPAYPGILAKLQWRFFWKAWKRASKEADGGFVVSVHHRDFIIDRIGTNLDIHVVPAGFDPETMPPPTERDENEILQFIYHGRLDKRRSIVSTIDLVQRLRKEGMEAELTLLGEGDSWDELANHARSKKWLKLKSKIPHDEVASVLSGMDIGLLPMKGDGVWSTSSPIKLFEYAANGLTVVATDLPSHHIGDSEGWLHSVPADSFVSEGADLILSSGFINKLRESRLKARRTVEEGWTWKASAIRLAEVIESHGIND